MARSFPKLTNKRIFGRSRLKRDCRLDLSAKLMANGQVAWETRLGDMLFGFLFDAIHHRGQLSSYLRPMGAKVPSIYGESYDATQERQAREAQAG